MNTVTTPGKVRDHIVDNPGGLDLVFTGEKLLSVNYHDVGSVKLYRTQGGRYVMRQRRSSRPGFIEIDRLEIGQSAEQLLDLLVTGRGVTAMRAELGLDTSIRLD
ncbi:hypothetical protein [Novosphingopyxis sp. YJ-S2-01]|uniref:hypothetical protein n=1 Tax=Novosphingopyxis sp. YJ-S2-01 TaxID=2794021 RepID=UPI0018DC9081|nr:hypothetical protein [Novosphingopyxis sp. YJ-S2-01]MBH9537702.1 hypothetical protein [Novosphingopyxis sp. YJ-S2-01]